MAMKIPYGIWFNDIQIHTISNALYEMWLVIFVTAIGCLITRVIMVSIYIGLYIDAWWRVIRRKYIDDLGL